MCGPGTSSNSIAWDVLEMQALRPILDPWNQKVRTRGPVVCVLIYTSGDSEVWESLPWTWRGAPLLAVCSRSTGFRCNPGFHASLNPSLPLFPPSQLQCQVLGAKTCLLCQCWIHPGSPKKEYWARTPRRTLAFSSGERGIGELCVFLWFKGKESTCQCRRCGFHPRAGKKPWRSKWQPTPVFLPRKSHGQRSLAGYSPWSQKRQKLATKQQQERRKKYVPKVLLTLPLPWLIIFFFLPWLIL